MEQPKDLDEAVRVCRRLSVVVACDDGQEPRRPPVCDGGRRRRRLGCAKGGSACSRRTDVWASVVEQGHRLAVTLTGSEKSQAASGRRPTIARSSDGKTVEQKAPASRLPLLLAAGGGGVLVVVGLIVGLACTCSATAGNRRARARGGCGRENTGRTTARAPDPAETRARRWGKERNRAAGSGGAAAQKWLRLVGRVADGKGCRRRGKAPRSTWHLPTGDSVRETCRTVPGCPQPRRGYRLTGDESGGLYLWSAATGQVLHGLTGWLVRSRGRVRRRARPPSRSASGPWRGTRPSAVRRPARTGLTAGPVLTADGETVPAGRP
jgi:hypothetical protein